MLATIAAICGYIAAISFVTILAIYVYFKHKNRRSDELLSRIPSPKAKYPLIGNLDLFRIKGVPLNECVYRTLVALSKMYDKYGLFRIQLGPSPVVVLFKHHTVHTLLTSNTNIGKSEQYMFLLEWLGEGLLTSTGAKWKGRRKLLTPAFHFKILDDFIPIMCEQSDILVQKLMRESSKPYIDVREPITQCTLDVICETAMGVSIGAQLGKNTEYVNAIHNMGEILMKRVFSPWIWSDFVFYRTGMGRLFASSLKILHTFTRNVINDRKSQLMSAKTDTNNDSLKSDDNMYLSDKRRKRLAFMDLLLEHHMKDNALTIDDIREEVDTFMFEGHDTTSVSLGWTLYLLGRHPDVQNLIHEELSEIFGDDIHRDITTDDLSKMSYLECVLKESLRMYPSVPFIGRKLTEDLNCGDDYVVPKGTNVFLFIERMHFDSNVFPDPLHFKPERFRDESTGNINAYSYVPFSAGARSCIGKRFAVNEEKIILAKICLNFRLESIDPIDKIQVSSEMVFRAKDALNIKFIPKYKQNL